MKIKRGLPCRPLFFENDFCDVVKKAGILPKNFKKSSLFRKKTK